MRDRNTAQHSFRLFVQRLRALLVLGALILMTACATRLSLDSPLQPIQIQNKSLGPQSGGNWLDAANLQIGDILLSSNKGLTSGLIQTGSLVQISHAALYVGNGQIVEAVLEGGVQTRDVNTFLAQEDVVVALRHPDIRPEQAKLASAFVLSKVGTPYSKSGIVLQTPFTLGRKACELPLLSEFVRQFCLSGMAMLFMGASSPDKFFCSQLIADAYKYAGVPLTYADPRWISPADLLHMREGDVPSFSPKKKLEYLGHLKSTPLSLGELSAPRMSPSSKLAQEATIQNLH